MPLTWNIGEIAMYKDNIDSAYIERNEGDGKYYDLVPATKGFIFWGGVVAMGWITETNASEFYARTKVAEKITNITFMTRWGTKENGEPFVEDVPMTMQDVKNHIGLSTNHGMRSTAEWVKIFVQNNKDVSPEAKVVKAMLTVYKYEYEQWEKQNASEAS